jgi:hypothetical protein
MISRDGPSVRSGWAVVLLRVLRVAAAALLAVDAYVHLHDAGFYDTVGGAIITQGWLFRIQAGVAIVVALALLVRAHWFVWLVALLVAASAAGAVYLYTYVDVGPLGPLPDMFEPTWGVPGKRVAAAAEIAATSVALLGLALALHVRRSDDRQTTRPASHPPTVAGRRN